MSSAFKSFSAFFFFFLFFCFMILLIPADSQSSIRSSSKFFLIWFSISISISIWCGNLFGFSLNCKIYKILYEGCLIYFGIIALLFFKIFPIKFQTLLHEFEPIVEALLPSDWGISETCILNAHFSPLHAFEPIVEALLPLYLRYLRNVHSQRSLFTFACVWTNCRSTFTTLTEVSPKHAFWTLTFHFCMCLNQLS